MRHKWILITSMVTWIFLIVACSSVFNWNGQLASADSPRFDHKGHIDRGVDCVDCHGEENVDWQGMPELEFCMECHEDIDPEVEESERASAFYDEQGVGQWIHAGAVSAEVKFTHSLHIKGPESCLDCHANVATSSAIYVSAALSMEDCTTCHTEKARKLQDCASCHKELREDVAPKSHRAGFRQAHGRTAIHGDYDTLPQNCSYCHTKSSCDECHRAEVPRDHTNTWRLAGHGVSSSIDRERCEVCHTTDSCSECHRQTVPRNHRAVFGAPFNRHCNGCHVPLGSGIGTGCAVCHDDAPSHSMATIIPGNLVHQTLNPNECRACHTPMEHTDNGQSCLLCHQ